MQPRIDRTAILAADTRLTPAQRALFCSLRRILIAALKTIDELLVDTRA